MQLERSAALDERLGLGHHPSGAHARAFDDAYDYYFDLDCPETRTCIRPSPSTACPPSHVKASLSAGYGKKRAEAHQLWWVPRPLHVAAAFTPLQRHSRRGL